MSHKAALLSHLYGIERGMNFFESVRTCLLNFVNFNGRSRRSEFWWFQLFLLILMAVALIIDTTVLNFRSDEHFTPFLTGLEILTFLPFMSLTTRRLHDIGLSGWYQLPMWGGYFTYLEGVVPSSLNSVLYLGLFIAVVWMIWMIFKLIKDSHPETNQYGPSPKL